MFYIAFEVVDVILKAVRKKFTDAGSKRSRQRRRRV